MRRLLQGTVVVGGLAWLFIRVGDSPTQDPTVESQFPAATGAPVWCRVTEKLRRGESFYDLMLRQGLSPRQALEAGAALGDLLPAKQLRAGDKFSFYYTADSSLPLIRLERSALERYELVARGDGFVSVPVVVEVDTIYHTVSGVLDANLWTSFTDVGAPPSIIVAFTEVFAWSVDFFREARPGDAFGVHFSALHVESDFVGTHQVEAAYYVRGGDTLWAFAFEDLGQTKYYNEDGLSLKKALLRAPLKYSRVTSGFTRKRYHPVYQTYKPHYGVDYAADRGTPIYAAGDGLVQFAGRKRGLGICVEIRHPNGYHTVYGHLSKIARGVKAGRHVEQKQRIGSVGATGNATGPHLHYEVWQGKKPINPRALKLPAKGPVPETHRRKFEQHRDLLMLELAPVYGPLLAVAG